MNLHSLKPAKGSIKKRKRVGRGQGSGRGGTSTRGHKGAKSRSGYSRKRGFEGGQMPLQRRIPKFGFNNPNKIIYKAVNLLTLQKLADEKGISSFNLEVLNQNGYGSKNDKIKVLGQGELSTAIEVTAHKFSKTAIEAIEKAGGKAIVIAPQIKESVEETASN